jgi:hypothetical protein
MGARCCAELKSNLNAGTHAGIGTGTNGTRCTDPNTLGRDGFVSSAAGKIPLRSIADASFK